MRIYVRTCDSCGDRASYKTLSGVNRALHFHNETVCAKQKAAKEKYRSLSWDEEAWVVLLTVRGDVFDAILKDMGRFHTVNVNKQKKDIA